MSHPFASKFNNDLKLKTTAHLEWKYGLMIDYFGNGNGRHSRIFTDIVRVFLLKEKPMKWAEAKLEDMTAERSAYISGLRKADGGDFAEFIEYLRSLGN